MLGRGEETSGGGTSPRSSPTPWRRCSARSTRARDRGRPRPRPPAGRPAAGVLGEIGAGLDWKTSLQELTSTAASGVPEYAVTEEGPDHAKPFHAVAMVQAGRTARAAGGARRRPNRRRPPRRSAGCGPRWTPRRAADPDGSRPARGRVVDPIPILGPCPSCPRSRWSAAGLARWVAGSTITRVEVRHPRPVRRHEAGTDDFTARLVGVTVLDACRRGKFLWLTLDSGEALLAHLGMSGQLVLQPPDAPAEAHLRVRIGAGGGRRPSRSRAAVRRPADVRRAGRGAAGAGHRGSAAGAVTGGRREPNLPVPVLHIARDRWTRRWTRPRSSAGAQAPERDQARTAGPDTWSPGSATSTPTRGSGRPGCTTPGRPRR